MEAKQVREYKKHGYHFAGNLVYVEYSAELCADPRHKQLGIALAYEYRDKAAALVAEAGYDVVKVLTTFPDYVVRVR